MVSATLTVLKAMESWAGPGNEANVHVYTYSITLRPEGALDDQSNLIFVHGIVLIYPRNDTDKIPFTSFATFIPHGNSTSNSSTYVTLCVQYSYVQNIAMWVEHSLVPRPCTFIACSTKFMQRAWARSSRDVCRRTRFYVSR